MLFSIFLFDHQVEELDEKLLTQFAYNARGDFCPMQGVIGGITAQEVMKVPCMYYIYLLHVLYSGAEVD